MEDLENRLSAMGYGRVGQGPECWQVSRAGAPSPQMRRAPQPGDPPCSAVLRFWLRRLGRFDASPFYRIQRAI